MNLDYGIIEIARTDKNINKQVPIRSNELMINLISLIVGLPPTSPPGPGRVFRANF